MRPLGVAVWGLGSHAINNILPAVAATPGLELYGVCSRSASKVATCAEAWSCQGWTEAASMLADPRADIVYVATPIGLHAEHGKRVLDAGKHLWCEKPITCRLQATLDLLELSRTHGLSICEGLMYLHHPHFRQLSRYVTEGRLGRIRSIGCRFGIPRLAHGSFRTDPALGGGALFDLGCYPLSAIDALFPTENQEIAYSRIMTRDGSAVDTDGDAVIELSNGAVALVEWRINCSYRNDIGIWGDKASLFTDRIFSKSATHVPVFHLRDTQGTETDQHGEAANHFVSMLECFRSMILRSEDSEAERSRIARRAEVLDQIWSRSRSSKERIDGHCSPLSLRKELS